MGTNTVEVNAADLSAEVQRALAGAPPDAAAVAVEVIDGPPLSDQPAPPVESWGPLIEGAVPTLRLVVFAQWDITPEMEREFAKSLTLTLDMLFPGGLDGKYAPVARLLACAGGIVAINYMKNGGKLPPLGPPKKKTDDKQPAGDQRAAA